MQCHIPLSIISIISIFKRDKLYPYVYILLTHSINHRKCRHLNNHKIIFPKSINKASCFWESVKRDCLQKDLYYHLRNIRMVLNKNLKNSLLQIPFPVDTTTIKWNWMFPLRLIFQDFEKTVALLLKFFLP